MPDSPRPTGFAAAFNRLPLPVLFIVAFVIWTGLGLLLRDLQHTLDPVYIALRILGGLALAGLTTAVAAKQRRTLGGADEVQRFGRALRTGDVPADVDRAAWRTELDWQRRRTMRVYWIVLPVAALMAAFGIWSALLAPHREAAGWGFVAIAVVFIVAALAVGAYSRRRLDRLQARLGA